MEKDVILRTSVIDEVIGIGIVVIPPLLITLIPVLWVRVLVWLIYAIALFTFVMLGLKSDDVVIWDGKSCINNAFNTECPKLGGNEPPKGFKFGDF